MKKLMRKWIVLVVLSLLVCESASAQHACVSSSDDESNVEYFNEIMFNDLIAVSITDTGTQFELTITCPPRQSSAFPPQSFRLTMYTTDRSMSTSCDTTNEPIVIAKASLDANALGYCTNSNCEFLIIADHRTTHNLYTQTVYRIRLANGNQTLIPDLNPATLPICDNTLPNCMTANTCALNSNSSEIKLCDSSTSCASSANDKGYSYSENVYFEAALKPITGN